MARTSLDQRRARRQRTKLNGSQPSKRTPAFHILFTFLRLLPQNSRTSIYVTPLSQRYVYRTPHISNTCSYHSPPNLTQPFLFSYQILKFRHTVYSICCLVIHLFNSVFFVPFILVVRFILVLYHLRPMRSVTSPCFPYSTLSLHSLYSRSFLYPRSFLYLRHFLCSLYLRCFIYFLYVRYSVYLFSLIH